MINDECFALMDPWQNFMLYFSDSKVQSKLNEKSA